MNEKVINLALQTFIHWQTVKVPVNENGPFILKFNSRFPFMVMLIGILAFVRGRMGLMEHALHASQEKRLRTMNCDIWICMRE
jgi:hypothetical protein